LIASSGQGGTLCERIGVRRDSRASSALAMPGRWRAVGLRGGPAAGLGSDFLCDHVEI